MIGKKREAIEILFCLFSFNSPDGIHFLAESRLMVLVYVN